MPVARLGNVSAAADEMHPDAAGGVAADRVVGRVGAHATSAAHRPRHPASPGRRRLIDGYARRIHPRAVAQAGEIAALGACSPGTLRVGAITTAEYLLPPCW